MENRQTNQTVNRIRRATLTIASTFTRIRSRIIDTISSRSNNAPLDRARFEENFSRLLANVSILSTLNSTRTIRIVELVDTDLPTYEEANNRPKIRLEEIEILPTYKEFTESRNID